MEKKLQKKFSIFDNVYLRFDNYIIMIKEKHSSWAKIIFYPFIRLLLKQSFSSFYLLKPVNLPEKISSFVITPNHFSWWDGFFIHTLCRILFPDKNMKIMMLEKQLEKYWYFRYTGAYSIEPGSRSKVMESLEHATCILEKNYTVSVIYPQGEILPYETGKIETRNGALKYISKKTDYIILPVVFKIHYYNRKKPDIIANPGEIITSSNFIGDFSFLGTVLENLRKEADTSACNMDYRKGIKLL